jgi:hypothetical protein
VSADSDALLAVEKRVRERIAARVDRLATRAAVYIAKAITTVEHTSALDLLSLPEIADTIDELVTAAEADVSRLVSGAYAAAASLAAASAGRQLRTKITVPDGLGGYLGSVLDDVHRAFYRFQAETRALVTAAHDGITGPGAPKARAAAAKAAVLRAGHGLWVRTDAAGAVVVHRGFEDATLAIFARIAEDSPHLAVTKTWQVTSVKPCPACAALDGTTLPAGHEFDHTATTKPQARTPGVYHDLQSPPRHPNCRCRLVLGLPSKDDNEGKSAQTG